MSDREQFAYRLAEMSDKDLFRMQDYTTDQTRLKLIASEFESRDRSRYYDSGFSGAF